MGINIELDVTDIKPPKLGETSKKHCAIGTIHYETVDKAMDKSAGKPVEVSVPTGTIIYFKASLTGDESTDIKNFQTLHPTFPHETTANQWFTESQFESYRELGYHAVMTSMNSHATAGTPAQAMTWTPADASEAAIQPAEMAQAVGEAPWPDTADSEQTLEDKEVSKSRALNKQLKDALDRFGFDTSRLT